jgi:hypothetical protein
LNYYYVDDIVVDDNDNGDNDDDKIFSSKLISILSVPSLITFAQNATESWGVKAGYCSGGDGER